MYIVAIETEMDGFCCGFMIEDAFMFGMYKDMCVCVWMIIDVCTRIYIEETGRLNSGFVGGTESLA